MKRWLKLYRIHKNEFNSWHNGKQPWNGHMYLVPWPGWARINRVTPPASHWNGSARSWQIVHSKLHMSTTLASCSAARWKLACLVRQALCGQMPIYLADDIHLVSESNRRSLRSSSDNMCAVPRTHNSFGDTSFGAVGPRIWNSLPCGLRTLDISYKHFKALLHAQPTPGQG